MQPVSAVAVSPPTTASQNEPLQGQVEISSGALPAPSAAQASQFADLVKSSKITEVTLQNHPSQRASTSKMSTVIDKAMKHFSEMEARAHREVQGPHDRAFTRASRTSTAETDYGRPAPQTSIGEHTASDPESSPEHLAIKDVFEYAEQSSKSTMMVMEFEIESTLYSKVAEKGGSSINQLVQEK